MAIADRRASSDPPLRRFKLATQKNRALLFTFATLVALILKLTGSLHASLVDILAIMVISNLSALGFYLFYRRWWRVNLDFLWFFIDSALVTWAIYRSGGAESPWFPWYLANVSGAAVAQGLGWAVSMAVVDSASYLLLLGGLGFFRGDPQALFRSAGLMLSLFASALFFLWGIVELQKKREMIKRLKEAESRKVEELTRLAAELDKRTSDLADANEKIRQADRLKSQFLANMSHELRTPLNSIIGFSEVLESRMGEGMPEKERRYLQHIHTSGQHLLGLINDLLDLSKIEAGKMELHPERFPVEHVIAGVCGIMKGVADRRGVTIEQRLDADLPPVEADPVKVKQILYNLLSNAVKFSPDSAKVTVAARPVGLERSPLGAESIEIQVVDCGPGIAPEDHEVIFEEFRQGSAGTATPNGGTGLGLALVKKFVDLHGGAVSLASAPGEGSTFTVFLPVQYPWRARRPEGAPAPDAEAGARVLVVEDDDEAYGTLAFHLARAGFGPIRARDGEEALRLVREAKPAAVTLDIVLPGLDGWEVLKKLKEQSGGARIPVVIVSRLDNRDLGLALGADDYFLKPLDGSAFTQRLRELIPSTPPQECTVLVVDDDPKVHELIEAILGDAGYRLQHALSGSAAFEAVERASPDLILLDLLMEGMSGFEVAERLSSKPETSAIPVVILTAKELTEEDRRTLTGNVAALLRKGGTDPQALVNMVRSLIRRTQALRRPGAQTGS